MPVALVPGLNKTHLESSVFRYVQETLGLKMMGSSGGAGGETAGAGQRTSQLRSERPGAGGGTGDLFEDGTPLEYAHCHYRYDHGGIILVNNG